MKRDEEHRALEAREERNASEKGTETRTFENGRVMGFLEAISLVQNMATAFDIPLEKLRLDDIVPERDLT